jgi:subtilisin-like proprotein convertase family protein
MHTRQSFRLRAAAFTLLCLLLAGSGVGYIRAQPEEPIEVTGEVPSQTAPEPTETLETPAAPTEVPTEIPTEVPTEITPEVTPEIPTAEPTEATPEVTPEVTLEVPTEVPTEEITPEVTAEPVVLQVVEAQDAASQSGQWAQTDDASASSGSYLVSGGSTADILTVTFEGSTLEIVYAQGPNFGAFVVEVDGAVIQPVNAQAESNAFASASVSDLSSGLHILRIVPLNGIVGIDTLTAANFILPEATPEATEPVDLVLSELESSLSLLYEETFDERAENRWSFGGDWVFVPNDEGWALNSANTTTPAIYNLESRFNIQAEARFLFEEGAVQLSIRRSDAGAYIAQFGADGAVTLYRSDVVLGTATAAPNVTGEWRTFAVSAVESNVRVFVDGVEVIAVSDSAPLPEGLMAFGAANASIPDLVVDDFTLTVPAVEGVLMRDDSDTVASDQGDIPVLTDTFAVQLSDGADANDVASDLGFENLGQIGQLEGFYVFRKAGADAPNATSRAANRALASDSRVFWFEHQMAERGEPDEVIDPLYGQQWHLRPQANQGANVAAAWDLGYTGSGVQIAIVDDGLEYTHPDLSAQYVAADSIDINFNDFDPFPGSGDFHGTSVGGVAAADDDGSSCGVGAAYDANLAGIRLLSASFTDSEVAEAITYEYQDNDIYNNSWRPGNGAFNLSGGGAIVWNAMEDSVVNGRGGLGSILVFSGGNDRQDNDNGNANGNHTTPYTITVAAVDTNGRYSYYSEPGATLLVAAPSNGNNTAGITTTDRTGANGYGGIPGFPDCTNDFGGTSSATPLVAGIIALMLEANPDLTWRDVQHILAATAFKNDPSNSDWKVNKAGYHINHNYGFGRVDGAAAVALAEDWMTMPDYLQTVLPVVNVGQFIPDANATGVTSQMTVSGLPSNFVLEHVQVVFNATHTYRGDLEVFLTAPSGTQSQLMNVRPDSNNNFTDWTFKTVRNWGETGNGVWKLKVADRVNADLGVFQNWQLILYGYYKPAAVNAAPVLTSPTPVANGATNLLNPLLTWNTVANAGYYHIQVDDAANFSSPMDDDSRLTDSFFVTSALTPGTKYYWRVRGRSLNQFGPWSAVGSFTYDLVAPTGEIKLSRPLNNSFTFDNTPVFAWVPLRDAKNHQLRIDDDASCDGGFMSDITNLTRPTYTLLTPLAEDTYWWCVRQADLAGNWTAWSIPYKFQLTLLKAPVNAPDPKSALIDRTPTFSWNRAVGTGITYRLLVDDDLDVLTGPIVDVSGLMTTSYTLPTELTLADTYYWRVIPSGGWTVTDPVIWSFLLTPTRLTAPILGTPIVGAFTNDTTPELTWDITSVPTIGGVSLTFEIWLDDNARFTSPYIELDPDGSHIVPLLPDTIGTRYYWKVRAVYDNLTAGPWSRTGNFTLDTSGPTGTPALTAPANGATATTLQPTFSWGAVTGATRYELLLELGDDTPDTPVYFGAARTFKPTIPLSSGTYYWQVIAYDAAGNPSPGSLVRSITIP